MTNKDLIIQKQEELINLAIKTIRAWHSMGIDKENEDFMWGIYNRNSPEMKRINELMAEIKSELATLKSENADDEIIDFAMWYSGMEQGKVLNAYKRYLREVKSK
jgi:hypothetical protein